jgi:hypothetical protein
MNDMKLQHINQAYDYELFHSELIANNKDAFIEESELGVKRFYTMFGGSTTWNYTKYNIFNLTSGYPLYYQLYKDLLKAIRIYVGHDNPLWMQAWINYHKPDEVLDWHSHIEHTAHGYISIEPHNTKTVFRGYEINNKVGQIYIGRCDLNGVPLEHKVEVLENFTTPRITIGFDINNEACMKKQIEYHTTDINLSFIPI